MKHTFAIVITLFAVTACATPYQASGLRGGYKDTPIAQDTYLVRFDGNGFTSRNTAGAMNLIRAAEMTLDAGHTRFLVLDANSEVDKTWVSGVTISKPGSELVIKFVTDGTEPEGSLDAMDVIEEHGPKVKYKGKYVSR
ncbi:CC0125/CC1285 family lipoprotein [Kordiimonas sp.]|uniref:CC0125/CC1285 family lipoprotein n=1 Tax=Kordiimonas sp. TaxID=1970157 RepID=UPI003A8CE48E